MKAAKVNYRPEFPGFVPAIQNLAKQINVCDSVQTLRVGNIFP
jgi:hypothetical protein